MDRQHATARVMSTLRESGCDADMAARLARRIVDELLPPPPPLLGPPRDGVPMPDGFRKQVAAARIPVDGCAAGTQTGVGE